MIKTIEDAKKIAFAKATLAEYNTQTTATALEGSLALNVTHLLALVEQPWQDIASAPKDGTEVLTLDLKYKVIHVASYVDNEWFVDDAGSDYEYQKITAVPDVWQPLPPLPKEQDEDHN